MQSRYSGRTFSLLALLALLFLPLVLTGQRAQGNVIPLKNWATPLYWQPNQAEREAAAKSTPQLQFSANAVSTSALTFVAITPCRLVDTRGAATGFNGIAPFSGPSILAGGTLTIPVQSATEATTNTAPAPCGVIPSIAQAYSVNLTVVPVAAGSVGYVSLWPAGSPQPVVATVNDVQGLIVNMAAIVPAGTPSGGISVFNDGPATTDVVIDMNGFFAAPTAGSNTAIGSGALASNTTGVGNTASGGGALRGNTTGIDNTGIGFEALLFNTTGNDNTAIGQGALFGNVTGSYNTAIGQFALTNNNGGANTATGYQALQENTTGSANTSTGFFALQNNTTGNNNTAIGAAALGSNTTGIENTALGNSALATNSSGQNNTASGATALLSNTTGIENAAFGYGALYNNIAGNNNIAIGYAAATNVSGTNSNNIHIGSSGSAGDSNTIRIGTPGTQTSFYAAGISGINVSGVAVMVDSNGQLGTVSSSRRFKEDIEDMGVASRDLMRLRPVTFRYKRPFADGSRPIQYGLIAEEVAAVYPDLVAHSADGQIETVKYQVLDSMLLNELQNEHQQIEQQAETIRVLAARLAALEQLLASKAPPLTPADR
jgi:hypothetical protein